MPPATKIIHTKAISKLNGSQICFNPSIIPTRPQRIAINSESFLNNSDNILSNNFEINNATKNHGIPKHGSPSSKGIAFAQNNL